METQKILLGQDGTATIRCPKCRKGRVVSAAKLKGRHRFKVKCTCKSVFGIQLEFREKYRQDTNLDGFVEKLLQAERWGRIIWQSTITNSQSVNCKIRNISVLGVGLTTVGTHEIKEGDHIKVEFTLDTPASPKIVRNAIVRAVKDNYIGCEFFETDKYDPKLGFYLL
jgi:hypothetical protein